jgi:hypothetical protein
MSSVADIPSSPLESALAAVAKLSREEKARLVEHVEAELSRDLPVPPWHLEVLKEREREGDEGALPAEETFRHIRVELQRDRDARR